MPFAIRHKETGELYTGQNWKAPKYYASRGAASGAMTNSVVNGGNAEQMLGISYTELDELSRENLVPTSAEIKEADEMYRRAQYDFKGNWEQIRPFRDALWRLQYDQNTRFMKNRREIIKSRLLWEVVEV
jgi:hypothetical protein